MAWVMQVLHENKKQAEIYSLACTKNPEVKCTGNGVFIKCPDGTDLNKIITSTAYNLSISGRKEIDN